MADIIKSRRDTAENWRTANPTLAEGELGFETDTKRYKLGDGKRAWNDLEYRDIDVVGEIGEDGVDSLPTTAAVLAKLRELGYYEDNPEYVRVITDSEGRLLFGIKTDGSIDWGAGVPKPIKDYVEGRFDDITEVIDSIKEIVDFIDGFTNSTTLKELLDKKVDGEYIDNPEFVKLTLDANDKILYGIRKDGTSYIPGLDLSDINVNPDVPKEPEEPSNSDDINDSAWLKAVTSIPIDRGILDNNNLINVDECVDNCLADDNGNIVSNGGYWRTGYIDVESCTMHVGFSLNPRRVVLYDKNRNYIETKLPAGLSRIYEVNRLENPNIKYVVAFFLKAAHPFEMRYALKCNAFGKTEISKGGLLLNGDYIRATGDTLDKDFLISNSTDYVFGTFVSETTFNDDDGKSLALNKNNIYVDKSVKSYPQYRFNGTKLYQVGCYDENALPFTAESFNIIVTSERNYNDANCIIRSTARYFLDPDNSTEMIERGKDTVKDELRPYVRICPISGSNTNDGYIKTTSYYTIGHKGLYETKEWRTFPNHSIHYGYRISVYIPEGVTLFISKFSTYYSDKKGLDPVFRHFARTPNAPDQSYAAFSCIERMGFRYATVIPKVTKDGVFCVFHDDTTIGDSLVNEDGTKIDNAGRISAYTYEELQKFYITTPGWEYNKIAFKEKIPTLEEFFVFCAKTGIHPAFSIHPDFSVEQWKQVKALTDKYRLTDKLTLKAGTTTLKNSVTVFGNNVEGITFFVNSQDNYDNCIRYFNEFVEENNIDKEKVNLCIEPFYAWASVEKIQEILSAGYRAGIAFTGGIPKQGEYEYWFNNGVTEFTELTNTSIGLNF